MSQTPPPLIGKKGAISAPVSQMGSFRCDREGLINGHKRKVTTEKSLITEIEARRQALHIIVYACFIAKGASLNCES